MAATQWAEAAGYEQASSYRRLGARIIDLVFGFFILLPLSAAPQMVLRPPTSNDTSTGLWFMGFFVATLVAYDTLLVRLAGRTIGMAILRMRVVDAKGDRPGWGNCLLRSLLLYLSGFLVAFLAFATVSILGWLFISSLRKYTRFPHDSLSRSFVVTKGRGGQPGGQATPSPLAELATLHSQGIISDEEYQRKKKELGL